MSIKVRNLGWWDETQEYSAIPKRVVLPTTTGTTIVVVADGNTSQAFGVQNTYGTGTGADVIRVFEINSAFATVTEVATISLGGNFEKPTNILTADLYSDNSIGIAYQIGTTSVNFRKVTYGTWAVAASEQIAGAPAVFWDRIDLSISDGNVPIVSLVERADTNPKIAIKSYVRRTSDSTWVLANTQALIAANTPRFAMSDVAVTFIKGGTGTARKIVLAGVSAIDGGADNGCRVWTATVNESTGALTDLVERVTYLAGDMTTKWVYMPRKVYLFATGTNEVTIAYMQSTDKRNLLVARATVESANWTQVIPPHQGQVGFTNLSQTGRFAATYANDVVNFYYIRPFNGLDSIINYIASIDDTLSTVRFSAHYKWDNLKSATDGLHRYFPMGGTGRNANIATDHQAIHFAQTAGGGWQAWAHHVELASVPTSITPSTTTVSSTPPLSLRARVGKQWPQSKHKAVWQIASNAAFTTDLRTHEQDDAKFINIEGTQSATSYVTISDTLPAALAITQGTWHIRAALIDEFNRQTAWSPGQQFTVAHPPVAVELSPSAGQQLVYGDGDVGFSWRFTDPSATDVQTAYQIIVERTDTDAIVLDTGKISSAAESAIYVMPIATKGIELRWKIRLWDSGDVAGNYSDYETFLLLDGPTVVINSPSSGGVVASSVPEVTFTPSVTGGRTIKSYRVVFFKAGVDIHSSGVMQVDVASGTQLTYRATNVFLANNQSYSVQVEATDNTNMIGMSPTTPFSTSWVPPASITSVTVSDTSYNTEGMGYVTVSWDDTERDVDFVAWVISRKVDLLDGADVVVEEGVWEEIDRTYDIATTYTYKDYYAPSGYKVNYRVDQIVNRLGAEIKSESTFSSPVYPRSEGYWILEPAIVGVETLTFRLSNVTSDDYTDEYEEAEYVILGRGRYVDRGDYLGKKGSLTAQIRDSAGKSARQKKLGLEEIKKKKTDLYIRTPFGDVFYVAVGNLGIARIAGVGVSEFVDITVPYSEVGANE